MRYCHKCTLLFKGNLIHCPIDGIQLIETDGSHLENVVLNNRYRLKKLIGIGGMSYVYLAEHIGMNRVVAIKFLLGDYITNEFMLKRFHRETETLSQIHHVNVVTIIDVSPKDTLPPYMVMEYLQGRLLEEILEEEKRLEIKRALKIAIQICDGLWQAHSLGIIHRDLKPGNIFVIPQTSGEEIIKIVDFGIAALAWINGKAERITERGVIFGTPEYIAPECAQGKLGDEKSDIYSLGVLLYEMVTGHLPFESEDINEIIYKHINEAPPLPIIPELPSKPLSFLQSIILKTLSKKPEDRYRNTKELLEDLKRCQELILKRESSMFIISPDETSGIPKKLLHSTSEKIKFIWVFLLVIIVVIGIYALYTLHKAKATLNKVNVESGVGKGGNIVLPIKEEKIQLKSDTSNYILIDSGLEEKYKKELSDTLKEISLKGLSISDLLYYDQRAYKPWLEQQYQAQNRNYTEALSQLSALKLIIKSLDMKRLLKTKFERLSYRIERLKQELNQKELQKILRQYNLIKLKIERIDKMDEPLVISLAKELTQFSKLVEQHISMLQQN